MSATKKPTLPTAAELQARLGDAERAILAATVALGEALVVQLSFPDRDVSAEREEVATARQVVEKLQAMLPVIEREAAKELAATREKLEDGRRRQLEKVLRDLLRASMQFTAAYTNAASAFGRMCQAGAEATKLLTGEQRGSANRYLVNRLSPGGLKIAADQEINRLGLRREGEISAPGTNPATMDLRSRNAACQLPTLEEDTRRMISLIMASAPEPLPRPQESRGERDLPKVAGGAGEVPTGSVEPPTGIAPGEAP